METHSLFVRPEQVANMTELQPGCQPFTKVASMNSSNVDIITSMDSSSVGVTAIKNSSVDVSTAQDHSPPDDWVYAVSPGTALRNPAVDSSGDTSCNCFSPGDNLTPNWQSHEHLPSFPGTPSSTPHTTQPQDPVMTSPTEAPLTALFKHVPQADLPTNPCMYWRLTRDERCLLAQLTNAYQDTLLAVLQTSPPSAVVDESTLNTEVLLATFEKDARRTVAFAKRLQDFRQLPIDEQIALIKASYNQVLGIQSCALFVEEKTAWLCEYGYYTLEQATQMFPTYPLINPVLKLCRTIKAIVKNDITLYALLHCILLFDPCDKRVIDRQLVNTIHDKYIILLRHYLQSLYSYDHSERYMMVLQENLVLCRVLCEEDKYFFKKLFPVVDNKLLVELMD